MAREWCFSYVFGAVRDNNDVVYKVVLYNGTDYAQKEHKSNACIFSKREIRKHLNLLKSLYPFEFSIKDYPKRDNYDRTLVTLKVKNVPATFHKYVLTWLRYTYEFPYNVLLKDAYILKKDPTFRFESIANLFNLAIGCYCEYPRDIHQIPCNQVSVRMKLSEVRERIKMVNRLNDIYKKLKSKKLMVPKEINGYSVNDMEYWAEGFEQRKSIYMTVYKEMKK